MKRTFILLLVTFFAIVNSYGQIGRDYMGFKLGSSTKSEVLKYIKSNGAKIIDQEDNYIHILNKINIMGATWDSMEFMFSDNLVMFIVFKTSDYQKPARRAALKMQKDLVKKDLMDKYAKYYIDDNSDDNSCFFTDSKTGLILKYFEKESLYFLTLTAVDVYLYQNK